MRFLGEDFTFFAELVKVYDDGKEETYYSKEFNSIDEAYAELMNSQEYIKDENDFCDITCRGERFVDSDWQYSDRHNMKKEYVYMYFISWTMDELCKKKNDGNADKIEAFLDQARCLEFDDLQGNYKNKTMFTDFFEKFKDYII